MFSKYTYTIILTPNALNKCNKYNLIFHPPVVVSRYCDPQLQVGENYWYLFNICKSWFRKTYFILNISAIMSW